MLVPYPMKSTPGEIETILVNGITAWQMLFYNFWGGKAIGPKQLRQRLSDDLNHLVKLLAEGTITPRIAARIPLTEASER